MIVRAIKNKENPYYVKNRRAVEDGRLSFKAKGIHDYLMSKPDHWSANVNELTKASTDGMAAVRSGVQELIDFGYMARVRVVDEETKRVERWELHTYETPELNPFFGAVKPDAENRNVDIEPDCGFPEVEKPHVENRIHSNYRDLVSNEGSKDIPPVSTSTGDPDMDAAMRKFNRQQAGLPVSNRREDWQIAEWNMEMPAKPRRLLAEAIAQATGKLALWNAGDDKLHAQLHEAAIKAHKMGYTPERVATLTDTWRDNWRAKGGGSVGQYLEFLSEQSQVAAPKQRRPRLAPMGAA